jgi:hypothetical protein
MGMKNSCGAMQRSLEGALGDVLYRGALAYVDNIYLRYPVLDGDNLCNDGG